MSVPEHVRRAVLFLHADRCFYCGREADTVDHIIAGDGDEPTRRRATLATPPKASDHCLTLPCRKPAPKHG